MEGTQNPPLASYYIALVGSVAGWSERLMHLSFLLPALGVTLGTYRLAQRFTQNALLAAGATLLTPGFLVSATGVMCDTMMLALWLLAAVFWIEGGRASTAASAGNLQPLNRRLRLDQILWHLLDPATGGVFHRAEAPPW